MVALFRKNGVRQQSSQASFRNCCFCLPNKAAQLMFVREDYSLSAYSPTEILFSVLFYCFIGSGAAINMMVAQ